MSMNRRGFLALAGAAAAGLVLDPERLLWVPGRKRIFLPAKPSIPDAATLEAARKAIEGAGAHPSVVVCGGALKRGDVITIGGVYARHPMTMALTAHLQQFVVTSDAVAGEPVMISPKLVPAGTYQATPLGMFSPPLKPKDRGWSHKRA